MFNNNDFRIQIQRILKRSGWSMFIDTFNILMLCITVAGDEFMAKHRRGDTIEN